MLSRGWIISILARHLMVSSCLLLVSFPAWAQELQPIPELAARVTDSVGLLTPSESAELEGRLTKFEETHGSQIAILIVRTTRPEPIEAYSIRVVEKWKLGRKKVDDGVLILVSSEDKVARIEVGYGLEGTIPDATAKDIIRTAIAPNFKESQYYKGLDTAVTEIIQKIESENLPAAGKWEHAEESKHRFSDKTILIVFCVILVVGFVIRFILDAALGSVVGHLLGGSITGLVAFGFSWFALGEGIVFAFYVGLGFFAFLILGLNLLLLLLSVATGGKASFGGGGGSFGGGGASGNW